MNVARIDTPEDRAIQTPNADTPYSFIGLDLRTEPLALTVAPIEKEHYFSLQFILNVDVGADEGTPAIKTNQVPFRFSGTIGKVTIDRK